MWKGSYWYGKLKFVIDLLIIMTFDISSSLNFTMKFIELSLGKSNKLNTKFRRYIVHIWSNLKAVNTWLSK